MARLPAAGARAAHGVMRMRVVNWERERGRAILEAIWALQQGRLIVYPTDTLYGIGADPTRDDVMRRVNEVKGRAPGTPISICIPDIGWLKERVTEAHFARAAELLPGPVTLLIPVKERIAAMGSSSALGVRWVRVPAVEEITRRFGPITTTSANRHGEPPATTCEEARRQLGDAVDVYIDAGPARIGRPSRIISLEDESVVRE